MSPDSDLLAAGGSDGSVTLWDLASGNPVRVFHAHSGAVWAVAFSPDSHHLASAGSDGAIRLWDPATGQPTHTLHGHTRAVWAVAFSPDGHHLASASDDGAIRLWDLTNGGCLAVLVARTGGWVVLRPDGTYTLDGDITGELWWAAGLCRFEPGELDP